MLLCSACRSWVSWALWPYYRGNWYRVRQPFALLLDVLTVSGNETAWCAVYMFSLCYLIYLLCFYIGFHFSVLRKQCGDCSLTFRLGLSLILWWPFVNFKVYECRVELSSITVCNCYTILYLLRWLKLLRLTDLSFCEFWFKHSLVQDRCYDHTCLNIHW